MENKYFTPSIEDIRVGYECEELLDTCYNCGTKDERHDIRWEKRVFKELLHSNYIYEKIKNEKLRVPYLTKEQIEAEGWKELKRELDGFGKYSYFQKETKHITFQEKEHILEIHNDEAYSDHQTWYEGECKDINTFRQIMKLLGI